VLAMIWEGENVIAVARQMMGKTNPAEAAPGTIRGDYGISVGMNIIHGSDSPESAEREIEIWFEEQDRIYHENTIDRWISRDLALAGRYRPGLLPCRAIFIDGKISFF